MRSALRLERLPDTINDPNNRFQFAPSQSADRLSLYFNRSNSSSKHVIYVSTRATLTDAWGTATALPTAVNGASQIEPCISSDGLSLLYTRVRNVATDFELWVSTRDTLSSPWHDGIRLPAVVNVPGYTTGGAWLSPDNQTLYYHSYRPGGSGRLDLWQVSIPDPSAAWLLPGAAMLLAMLRPRKPSDS